MLSVICPIYNEEKYIARCVESILAQDYPREQMEVLFMDGMSTDKTRDILARYAAQYPFIRVEDNPERIVPYAMNRGILASCGDVIIRLDAHAFYPENYFSTLVRSLEELHADNVGAVCKTLPANDTWLCKAIAMALSSSFGVGNSFFRIGTSEIKQVDTVPFGCFPRRVFDEVGLYDVDLVRNQDDELNARIIQHGGKIYLLPDLIVEYYARETIRKIYRMFYQYGLYKPLVNKKLGAPATVRQFFPLVFVGSVLLGGILGVVWPWVYMVMVCVLFVYIVLGISVGLRNREPQADWREIGVLPVVFFAVHWGYGWGYLNGLWKLLTHKTWNVEINR